MSRSRYLAVLVVLFLLVAVHAAAQTCRSDIAASTPSSRFVINANATVTDSATGLIWKRCSEGQSWDGTTCSGSATTYTWQQALQAGSDAVFAEASDWRLPNSKELSSLVESQCTAPAMNLTIFPAAPSSDFWSSSPWASDSGLAWFVDFGYGSTNGSSGSGGVRLVRGGQ